MYLLLYSQSNFSQYLSRNFSSMLRVTCPNNLEVIFYFILSVLFWLAQMYLLLDPQCNLSNRFRRTYYFMLSVNCINTLVVPFNLCQSNLSHAFRSTYYFMPRVIFLINSGVPFTWYSEWCLSLIQEYLLLYT